VLFQVRHLISRVRGRFSDFEGAIDFDAEHPERSKVALTIRTASIDTNEPNRDTHLRSGDFFDVDRYPLLTFTSTSIRPRGGQIYDVEGDLTIRGVARRITLPVTHLGMAKDPWGQEKVAFEGETTLNGLNWNAALESGGFLVGDDVKVTFSIQAA
jgi:polyisoprenoid-binding protein YceI